MVKLSEFYLTNVYLNYKIAFQLWWSMLIIPAFGKDRGMGDQEFRASLGYIASSKPD